MVIEFQDTQLITIQVRKPLLASFKSKHCIYSIFQLEARIDVFFDDFQVLVLYMVIMPLQI